MATLYQAQITPTKIELLRQWLPTREWFAGDADAEFTNVAAYRFDDPDGEVGVETILVTAGDSGPTMHVPLTYRGAPLVGAESSLICTMEHSVLGKRWVYDGAADPVYVQTVATATLNGGHQADLHVEREDGRVERAPNALVTGSGNGSAEITAPSVTDVKVRNDGSITIVDTGKLQILLQRVIGGDNIRGEGGQDADSGEVSALRGTWTGSDEPQELVLVFRR